MKFKFYLLFFFLTFALNAKTQHFVEREGSKFNLNGKPYYYIGANYWYGGLLGLSEDGKKRLVKELDFLKAKNVTNLRVLAAVEGSGQINGVSRVPVTFQKQQGVFNNNFLTGLDFLLSEMGKRNMKAVLFLSNNWEWSGGFLQYLNWNGLMADSVLKRKYSWDEYRDYVSKYYDCAPCKKAYMAQLKKIISRKNTFSKILYINDPAIMAWEVANEPRPMRPSANNAYENWLKEVTETIKKAAPKQLVTLGVEGEMGTEDMALFKRIHADENVDYLTIHMWPKNWKWFNDESFAEDMDKVLAKTRDYIQKHEQVARELNKPLVIEEFGLPRDGHSFTLKSTTKLRDTYYGLVFSEWLKSAQNNGSITGVNFWAFGGYAKPIPGQVFWKHGDDFTGDPPMEEQGLNSVFVSDSSTWVVITNYLKSLKKYCK